ncbi:MAG: right-handed parallel beta-helix repeat-containing protein, partial [Chthoniobacterales bacterium]
MSRFLSIAAVLCGFALSAHAQATRTWVSGVGDDANPCSRTAPCKTFAGAISKTAAGGEISVLDPGGFGVVTITKSITINGTGTLAGILSAGSPAGVIVNAGVNDTVILRDLSLNGAGTGTNGIRYLAAKTVVVDHCSIYGMTSRGIDAALNATGNLKVCNSIIENVLEDGIHMNTGAGFLTAMLDGSQIMNCGGDAIEAVNNVRGEVIHSRLLAAG